MEDAYFSIKEARSTGMLDSDKRAVITKMNQETELSSDDEMWNEILKLSSGTPKKKDKPKASAKPQQRKYFILNPF